MIQTTEMNKREKKKMEIKERMEGPGSEGRRDEEKKKMIKMQYTTEINKREKKRMDEERKRE